MLRDMGRSMIFLRVGGKGADFQKGLKMSTFYFLGQPNQFSELFQSTKTPCCGQNVCTLSQIFEKQEEIILIFLGTFWTVLIKTLRFFR